MMYIYYFYIIQNGWANIRWENTFFTLTIPYFAESNRLISGGCIFLPNISCIDEGLRSNFDKISLLFRIYRLSQADENPLSLATSLCNETLLNDGGNLKNGDPVLYNDNQLIFLNEKYPFFKLVRRQE